MQEEFLKNGFGINSVGAARLVRHFMSTRREILKEKCRLGVKQIFLRGTKRR
jgi:hypothetical protein